jgi:HrpA-like RNA helicase
MPEFHRADGGIFPSYRSLPISTALNFPLEHRARARISINISAKMSEFDLSSSFIPSLHKPSALLPIARHHASLLYLVETFQVVIVVGQTGSGKTTQIPQYLEQAGWCQNGMIVAVTQVGRSSYDPESLQQAF